MGVTLVILSLVHTPLPQPDFHNIRHHDGPGEVCEHHDHLLRWHPGAGLAEDVAVLHWHWFVPLSQQSDPAPRGTGLALHAHVPDDPGVTGEDGPQILSADTSTRYEDRAASDDLTGSPLAHPDAGTAADSVPGPRLSLAFSATFAPRATLPALLQRWVC